MKMLLLLFSVMACSCVNQSTTSEHPTPKAVRFFTDYVNDDDPTPDTLQVFLSACRGDHKSLDEIFSDYKRYGSGDNEAWGDVPDVLLEELGDQRFSSYTRRQNVERKVAVLKWLGVPGSTLYEDPDLRRLYPETSALQEDLFATLPAARP